MIEPKVELSFDVDISVLNQAQSDIPSGNARCEFMDDGSLKVFLTSSEDVFCLNADSTVHWQFGLMGLVNKENIYLSIGLGVVAKVLETNVNNEIESWLKFNHPKD